MNNINYLLLAENIVKQAKKQGAQAKISIKKDKYFSVGIRNNEVEELQEAGSTALSILINLDGKIATAATSDFTESTLNNLLKNAIERAKLASIDESAIFPEFEKTNIDPEFLELYSENINDITPDKKIDIAKQLEAMCLADNRITVSAGSGYGTNESEYFLILSNGFSGSYKRSNASVGVYLQSGQDTTAIQEGWYDSAISPFNLMPIEEIAKIAIERTTRLQNSKKINTQTVPVIIDRYAAGSVIGFALQCLNGRNIYMQQSVFAEKINKKIANNHFTLIDNPLMRLSSGSRPFDSEGVPARKNIIIENGILKNYLLNTYSAKKLNLKNNGFASGISNLILEKGKYSEQDLIKSIDKGLLLFETIGQGTTTTTGDFSKGAYGMWIENGELAFPVSEITISGNIVDMLNGIEMIADNPDMRKTLQIPSFKINNMTISGE